MEVLLKSLLDKSPYGILALLVYLVFKVESLYKMKERIVWRDVYDESKRNMEQRITRLENKVFNGGGK